MARVSTSAVPSHKARSCQVPGCEEDLQGPKYYRRYRICNQHCNQLSLEMPGMGVVRFCHLCRHFQPVEDFLGARKSCRASLAEHRLRAQRRGKAHDSGMRPMDEDSTEEHSSGAQHDSGDWEQQEAAGAQHSSSRNLQQGPHLRSGRRQGVDPRSPLVAAELVADSWGCDLAIPAGATPVGAIPAGCLQGHQAQQAAQGTSNALAPGHSASIASLTSLLLPGAADAGLPLEAASPVQQSLTELDDFMDWLAEQPDSASEWLGSVEGEQAESPVAAVAQKQDYQDSELPSQEAQQMQPWLSTTGGSTCPTPPESPIGMLESMEHWWPSPCTTPLVTATYTSSADLELQQWFAQPLQPTAPAAPPVTQAPRLLLQPPLDLQQQCSNFGSDDETLLLAVQWRAEQLSQRLFNISANLLPLGLRQTILHIAAQP